jgi:transposase
MRSVAQELGIGSPDAVRTWFRNTKVNAGARPGVTGVESAELRQTARGAPRLRSANEILEAAGYLAAEVDRPQRNS